MTIDLLDKNREQFVDMEVFKDLKMSMGRKVYIERINGLMSFMFNTRNIQVDQGTKVKMISEKIDAKYPGKRRFRWVSSTIIIIIQADVQQSETIL